MAFNFAGKKVLVTGVGRGIGKNLALALADAGADVYGLSKTQANLDALVELNPKIHPIQVDLSDWDATRAALESLDVMDALVNNAGIGGASPTLCLTTSKDDINRLFSVNFYAALNVTQIVGKQMVDAGKCGSIVNVSSVCGLQPANGSLPYATSKAALDMMTKQFALELGPHGIRVNSVNPTLVKTDMTREFLNDPVKPAKVRSHTPLGRFGEMSEFIGPIMYLLSDHSTMVTGTMHVVDGGLLSNISV